MSASERDRGIGTESKWRPGVIEPLAAQLSEAGSALSPFFYGKGRRERRKILRTNSLKGFHWLQTDGTNGFQCLHDDSLHIAAVDGGASRIEMSTASEPSSHGTDIILAG